MPGAQRGDSAPARELAQVLDAGVGEHVAVADQDQPLQAETAALGLNLVGNGGWIGGVAGIGPHCGGPPAGRRSLPGLFGFVEMEPELKDMFGRRVGLMTYAAIEGS